MLENGVENYTPENRQIVPVTYRSGDDDWTTLFKRLAVSDFAAINATVQVVKTKEWAETAAYKKVKFIFYLLRHLRYPIQGITQLRNSPPTEHLTKLERNANHAIRHYRNAAALVLYRQ